MITTQYSIVGMTCQHCVSAVTDELSALHGVRTVGIDLVPNGISVATVTGSTTVDTATVEAAIAEAGYRLAGV